MSQTFRAPQLWDLGALTAPVDRTALAAYRRTLHQARAQERRRHEREQHAVAPPSRLPGRLLRGALMVVVLGMAVMLTYGLIASLVVSVRGALSGHLPDSHTLSAAISCLILIVAMGIWAPLSSLRSSLESYRLDCFARANGGTHDPLKEVPSYPSAVFEPGDVDRRISGSVRLWGTRGVEFGNYSGGGVTRSVGYAAIDTATPLPAMTLVLTRLSMVDHLYPARYDKSHSLDLPEPSNRMFTLYARPEAARVAGLFFDADLLAQLTQGRRRVEIDVDGSRVLLYTRGRTSSANPAAWQSMLHVVDAVVHRIERLENRTTR